MAQVSIDVADKTSVDALSAKMDKLIALIGAGVVVPKYISEASDNVLLTAFEGEVYAMANSSATITECAIKGFSGIIKVIATFTDGIVYVYKNNLSGSQLTHIFEDDGIGYVEIPVNDGDLLAFRISNGTCTKVEICGTITEHTGKYTPEVVAL